MILYFCIGFIVLLILSAFFSSSETALFSLSELTIQKLIDEKRRGARKVAHLLKHPQRLLITILLGNTLVNVIIASVAALIVQQLCRENGFSELAGILLDVVVVTIILLIFSEITPKVFALTFKEKYSLKIAFFIQFLIYLFYPAVFLFTLLAKAITRLIGGKQNKSLTITEDEIKAVVDISTKEGSIEEDEKEMIKSLFTFSSTSVKEIMVPRTDMHCIEGTATWEGALKYINKVGNSRIPVYNDTIDKIDKVLYAKDLLVSIDNPKKELTVNEIARDAYIVPYSKKIDDLLKELKNEKIHIAIIVDEYGGTAGMVTMEDILEEIVGEIQDEHDKEEPLYSWIRPDTLLVNAKIDITELKEVIHHDLPEDGYETLGGLVLALADHVPQENEKIEHEQLIYKIKKVENNRIVSVEITLPQVIKEDSEKNTDIR